MVAIREDHGSRPPGLLERPELPVELLCGNRLQLEGERSLRRRIVQITRHEMDVNVRDGVPEQLVVEVARAEHAIDHAGDALDFRPEGCHLGEREPGGIRDVATAEDDDRVAGRGRLPLKVRIADTAAEEPDAKLVRFDAALSTEGAVVAALPCLPVFWPGSVHELELDDHRLHLRVEVDRRLTFLAAEP